MSRRNFCCLLGILALVVLAWRYGVLTSVAGQADTTEKFSTGTAEIGRRATSCLTDRMRRRVQSKGADEYKQSPLTLMYVFDGLVNRATRQSAEGIPVATIQQVDPDKLCVESLEPTYAKANAEARKDQRKENVLAPINLAFVESQSAFIKVLAHAQKSTSTALPHTAGHIGLTREALGRLGGALKLSAESIELIAVASQLPDIYGWRKEVYHAHSPDYADGNVTARGASIAEGRERFRAELARYFRKVQNYSASNNIPEALFSIGVIAHMIQDLVYHRGMTLSQHAGLAYVVKRNPDFPDEPLANARREEAVMLTMSAVRKALAQLDTRNRRRIEGWVPTEPPSHHQIALRVFEVDQEDMSMPELTSYLALSRRYLTSASVASLQQSDDCSVFTGLACWVVRDTVRDLLK